MSAHVPKRLSANEDNGTLHACAILNTIEAHHIERNIAVMLTTSKNPGIITIILFIVLYCIQISDDADSFIESSFIKRFPPGSHNGSTACFDVILISDHSVEVNRTLTLKLTSLYDEVKIGTPDTIVIKLHDDDSKV